MYGITRKKYSGEMKFTFTRALTHKTITELREELLRVKTLLITGKISPIKEHLVK